jgi:hypothetical protein
VGFCPSPKNLTFSQLFLRQSPYRRHISILGELFSGNFNSVNLSIWSSMEYIIAGIALAFSFLIFYFGKNKTLKKLANIGRILILIIAIVLIVLYLK